MFYLGVVLGFWLFLVLIFCWCFYFLFLFFVCCVVVVMTKLSLCILIGDPQWITTGKWFKINFLSLSPSLRCYLNSLGFVRLYSSQISLSLLLFRLFSLKSLNFRLDDKV